VRAKCEQDFEEMSYRTYMTEIVRLRGENKTLTKSWLDIIDPKPVDNRSGDEIAMQFIENTGLTPKGGD
jgi:hypothetical protein